MPSRFQFQSGAIESAGGSEFAHGFLSVSIPIWCDWKLTSCCSFSHSYWFQFQSGAIERPAAAAVARGEKAVSIPIWCDWKYLPQSRRRLQWMFQFQSGAIESSWYLPDRVPLPCFNSNLVRLKARARHEPDTPHLGFNSNLVRLKVPYLSWSSDIFKPVSIPIWCDWKERQNVGGSYRHSGFNSNLVRLKGLPALSPLPRAKCFNSNLVRLKVRASSLLSLLKSRFNSNLVRLKVTS